MMKKMKVLWLCNSIIPQVSVRLGISNGTGGGWLNQLSDIFDKIDDIELCVVAPFLQRDELVHITFGNKSEFYGFPKKIREPWRYDDSVEEVFAKILAEFKPDLVHIFGTEFPHTLSMVRVFNNPDKTIIHVQGIISAIAKHYTAFLSEKVVKRYSFRDFIKRDNIEEQKHKFTLRGEYEIEAIKKVGHVFHRTEWDEAVIKGINPTVCLHYAQEMMRKAFYSGTWNYDDCEKYSIFISQGNYPLKGLHIMLEALRTVRELYSGVKLYIAGDDILTVGSFKDKIRESYYSKYIRRLIIDWDLTGNVEFTGSLSEEKMKQRYLKSNVFVSASSIENSSNSVAEAMLLGVPIISSFVGGCASVVKHRFNGLLYQADAPYILSDYICQIFENTILAEYISGNEIDESKKIYSRETIVKDIVNTYAEILDTFNN
jgi:hypothetical protein